MKKFVLPRYLYRHMHMAFPSLPSVETSYSFDRQMIHCLQWMHSTPWALSETAPAGLQFIIFACHEAGKILAADSPFLFFLLLPNSIFSAWLSLDLALRLRRRIHPRPTFMTMVLEFSYPWAVHLPSRVCVGSGRKKSCQYTTVWLVYLATFQEKTGHWVLSVWKVLGQEGAGQFAWSEEPFIKVP